MLTSLKRIIKKIVYSIVPPPYPTASFSQAGEDVVLRFLFDDKKIKTISYLDIGTNIPDRGNNTFLFYESGCRGVCVEADSSLIDSIKRIRPLDNVINAGVSIGEEKEADFYIFSIPSINTFDKAEADTRSKSGSYHVKEVVKVPLIQINELIKNNFSSYPTLLSLDIEGLDLDVLKSLDFDKYPIPVICVETCMYSESHIRPKDKSIQDFMASKDYEVYADTYINTIFVNKNWFYTT